MLTRKHFLNTCRNELTALLYHPNLGIPGAIVERAVIDQLAISERQKYINSALVAITACLDAAIPINTMCKVMIEWNCWITQKLLKQNEDEEIKRLRLNPFERRYTPMRRDLDDSLAAIATFKQMEQRRWSQALKSNTPSQRRIISLAMEQLLRSYAVERYGEMGLEYLVSLPGRQMRASTKPANPQPQPRGRPPDFHAVRLAMLLLNAGLRTPLIIEMLNALEGRIRFRSNLDSSELPGPIYAWIRKAQHGQLGRELASTEEAAET